MTEIEELIAFLTYAHKQGATTVSVCIDGTSNRVKRPEDFVRVESYGVVPRAHETTAVLVPVRPSDAKPGA